MREVANNWNAIVLFDANDEYLTFHLMNPKLYSYAEPSLYFLSLKWNQIQLMTHTSTKNFFLFTSRRNNLRYMWISHSVDV